MSATLSTDEIALWRGCVAQHDDDTPRLALADYLEEHGAVETVPCPKCDPDTRGVIYTGMDGMKWIPCPTCTPPGTRRGAGTVTRQDSRAARAELLRVQVELNQRNRDNSLESNRLIIREGQILREWGDVWRKGPVCEKCVEWNRVGQIPDDHNVRKTTWHDCPKCHGTGDAGGLLRKFTYVSQQAIGGMGATVTTSGPVRVRYVRGTKIVEVPGLADCVEHNGDPARPNKFLDWQPTPWLAAVVEHHPDVEAVIPLSPEPHQAVPNWVWTSTELPRSLFDIICGHQSKTKEHAQLTLGRAVVRFAWESLKTS